MGFCTDMHGRLCCDNCGTAGGVRRVNCKYGYCPRTALCAACRKDPAVKAAIAEHCETNCKTAAAAFDARQKKEADLHSAGIPTRCAARMVTTGEVVVTFAIGTTERTGRVEVTMDTATYDAIPLLDVATIDDFKTHGKVTFA